MTNEFPGHWRGPPHPPTVSVDPAEVLALRLMVSLLLGYLAKMGEVAGGPGAQSWLDGFSTLCQAALTSDEFSAEHGTESEALRLETVIHINKIVASALFDDARRGSI